MAVKKIDPHILKIDSVMADAASEAVSKYMAKFGVQAGLPRLYWIYDRALPSTKRPRTITGLSDEGDVDSILAWARAFDLSRLENFPPGVVKYGRGIRLEGVRTRIEVWTVADRAAYDANRREWHKRLNEIQRRREQSGAL